MKQIQINKRLTIEEICPRWSQILHKYAEINRGKFNVDGIRLDILNYKRCIVGEAYGFSDRYDKWGSDKCLDCYQHSVNFASIMLESPTERKNSIESFVEHWNQCHISNNR